MSSDYEFHYVKGLEMKGATATGKTLSGSGTTGRAVNITGLSWAAETLSALPMWEDAEGYKYYFATTNFGADAETDFGAYYAWGELEGYKPTLVEDEFRFSHSFAWENYQWIDKVSEGVFKIHKYSSDDGKTVLDAEDDAAAMWIGGGWHIPTRDEWQGLRSNCNYVWQDNYQDSEVEGFLFTGKGAYASNSIFLPAAANAGGNLLGITNYYTYYWSSSLTADAAHQAVHLYANKGSIPVVTDVLERYCGTPIRAVLKIK